MVLSAWIALMVNMVQSVDDFNKASFLYMLVAMTTCMDLKHFLMILIPPQFYYLEIYKT